MATQAPNGPIHLITSMTHPSQKLEMNEAWILSDLPDVDTAGAALTGPAIRGEQRYPRGATRATWSARRTANGRYLLDGTERWFYPGGARHYQVTYRQGKKVGLERYWASDGTLVWEWERKADGYGLWTQYWPDGGRKHRSEWRDTVCHGQATAWTPSGEIAGEWRFNEGDLVRP
ncbi:MAG: hypothetical protein GEV06_17660 [Luteitalea sp.]|nr:hypothetical protein [Luteitalea sp.]